ncbi:intermembrane lipid transfer protein vps1301-like [Tasmannia lanceolata]|uniref:intermembrane lipid transfer protein vps1301-like n=1 Tax=Tasmannia lanceolata TaxID=3420 RepID=UPI004064891F
MLEQHSNMLADISPALTRIGEHLWLVPPECIVLARPPFPPNPPVQVLHLLRKYLGEYVQKLSTEALRISVWKGDVVLRDLQLKAEVLNSLKLPVTVKAGFVGTITLRGRLDTRILESRFLV